MYYNFQFSLDFSIYYNVHFSLEFFRWRCVLKDLPGLSYHISNQKTRDQTCIKLH